MAETTYQTKPTRLAFLTFLAVFGSIVVVGLLVVPFLIGKVEQLYLTTQSDINARQARSLANFASLRLTEGISRDEVSRELQILLAGSQADRGYSCVVDRGNAEFVCHPMAMALGMSVATKNASFLAGDEEQPVPWAKAIQAGLFGAGSLFYPDGATEIVHMEDVPSTDWTVTTHENTARVAEELERLRRALVIGSIIVGLLLAIPSSIAARAVSRRHEKRLEAEQARSERLLLNILPEAIAGRLKQNEGIIADRHSDVTVLFADIVGFTPWAETISAAELVENLNRIFSEFDDICVELGLEKIKTIGDAYMLCGGINQPADVGARNTIQASLRMLETIKRFSGSPHPLSLRIGIHTGDLVAGVIGKRKFSYDLWGDAVNTASRMESGGVDNRIQLSDASAELVKGSFALTSRGEISLKGKKDQQAWLVERRTDT